MRDLRVGSARAALRRRAGRDHARDGCADRLRSHPRLHHGSRVHRRGARARPDDRRRARRGRRPRDVAAGRAHAHRHGAGRRVLEHLQRRVRRPDAALRRDVHEGAERARPPARRAHRADGRRPARGRALRRSRPRRRPWCSAPGRSASRSWPSCAGKTSRRSSCPTTRRAAGRSRSRWARASRSIRRSTTRWKRGPRPTAGERRWCSTRSACRARSRPRSGPRPRWVASASSVRACSTDSVRPLVAQTKQLTVVFSMAYDPFEFGDTLRAIAEGEIDVTPMITGVCGVEGVPAAFEALGRSRGAREDPRGAGRPGCSHDRLKPADLPRSDALYATSTWKPAASSAPTIALACARSRVSIERSSRVFLSATPGRSRRCSTSTMLPCSPRDDGRDGGEHARPVGHVDLQPHQPPGPRERAQQHRRQHPRVDVAAARDERDPLAAERLGVLDHRSQRRRARALDHRLLDLDEQRHRGLDLLLARDEDLVDAARRRWRG